MKHLIILSMILGIISVRANDGVYYMSGNQLIPINETQVELRKEILTIKRVGGNMLIDVDYTFYNPGKAKQVLMGFEAPMPRGAADFRYNPWKITRNHPFLEEFIVEINGVRIPYKADIVNKRAFDSIGSIAGFPQEEIDIMNQDMEDDMDRMRYRNRDYYDFGRDWIFVNYFDANFDPGYTKIHHTYSFPRSYSNDMDLNFRYILTAANRWANGQIDDFTLVIDMGAYSQFYMPQSFFKGTALWNDAATMSIIDSANTADYWQEYLIGNLWVRGNGSKKPLVYKQKNFKPKGELHMLNYRDIYSSMDGYFTYNKVLSDTGIFDIAEHELEYSFQNHCQDLKYAADEFSLQVLRNYPFALRGYAFQNKKLRNYYESLSWYVADEEISITAKDLSNREMEWITRLQVFKEE